MSTMKARSVVDGSLLPMMNRSSYGLLDLHTNLPENKPSLSLFSISSSSTSEEGRGGQQILPKFCANF